MIDVEAGRQAIRKHRWAEAVAAFTAVGEDSPLDPDDLVMLGDGQWWSGRPDEAIETYERAYAEYERRGRHADAAGVGCRLAYHALRRLSMSVGFGWIARAQGLLEGQPESVSHGWMKILFLVKALRENDLDLATTLADEAIALARRFDNPGVAALALSFKGIALLHGGQWREGLTLIDEAAVIATTEEGDLRAASDVYCNTIAACRNLGDYRRASEWTEKAERWMLAHEVGGYPGVCQVHRAELKRLRGTWPEAEQEARKACLDLEKFQILDGVGFAYYEIGEVRRRMGDLAGAESSFMRAYEYGHDAQPGRALLQLNRGEVAEAAKSIEASLARLPVGERPGSVDVLGRAALLPAVVEISLAAGNVELARTATEQLEEVAHNFEAALWEASALTARGLVAMHDGDIGVAIESLGRGWRKFQEMGLPYEAAQARVGLGRARRAEGDNRGAALEFQAAASTFRQLGAAFDLRRLRAELGDDRDAAPGPRVQRVFMFTDIVSSTDLIGVIGDAPWENLLRWHDRMLRKAIADYGGEEVRHTGDGFFTTFADGRAGIDAAVSIQRGLETHRREHGFAPWLRIGLHYTEATQEAGDYSGQGVHAAARVAALAEREEVLATSDLLAVAGTIPYEVSAGRSVTLKGIAEPMTVHSINWR